VIKNLNGINRRIIFSLVGSSLIANLIALSVTPIIARIYGPRTLGVYFGLISLASVGSVVISRKVELKIPLLKSDKKAIELLLSNFISSFILIFILNIFISLSTSSGLINDQNILNRHRVEFNTLIIVFIAYANLTQINLRFNAFKRIRNRNIIQPILITFIQVLLGLKFPTVVSLVGAEIIGRVTSFSRTILSIVPNVSRKSIRSSLNKNTLFQISKGYPYFVFDALFSVYLLLFVMYTYGSEIGGQFAISWKIATAPAALFGLAINQFLIMKLGKSSNRSRDLSFIKPKLKVVLRYLTIFIILGSLFTGFFLIENILGPSWTLSGEFLMALSIFSVTNMYWTIFAGTAVLMDRQELLKRSAIIKITSLSIVSLLIIFYDTQSLLGVIIVATVISVTDLISIKMVRNSVHY
jgi:O-antigen/teichoic acid export membrane protein